MPPKCSSLAARPLSLRRPVMSIAASAAQATSSAATVVPDVQRSNFLPRLFGQRHFLAGEAQIFDTMRRLSPADSGGEFWEFYARGGEPLYLAPKSPEDRHSVVSGKSV